MEEYIPKRDKSGMISPEEARKSIKANKAKKAAEKKIEAVKTTGKKEKVKQFIREAIAKYKEKKKLEKDPDVQRGRKIRQTLQAKNDFTKVPLKKNPLVCFTKEEIVKALMLCGLSEEKAKMKASSVSYEIYKDYKGSGNYYEIYKTPKKAMMVTKKVKSSFEAKMDEADKELERDLMSTGAFDRIK